MRCENVPASSDELRNVISNGNETFHKSPYFSDAFCARNTQREKAVCWAHGCESFAVQVNIADSAGSFGKGDFDAFWEESFAYSFAELVVCYASNPA